MQDNKTIQYSLSDLQKGLLFQSLNTDFPGIYLTQTRIFLNEKIDINLLQKAWNRSIARHEILRAHISVDGNEYKLQITTPLSCQIKIKDISNIRPKNRGYLLKKIILHDKIEPFNLFQTPLMRLTLIKLDNTKYTLLWTHHHILLAAKSFMLILAETFNTYDAWCNNKKPTFKTLDNYSKHINYLHKLKKQSNCEMHKYWQKIFANFNSDLLPAQTFATKNTKANAHQKEITVNLSKIQTNKLLQFAQKQHLTLNRLLQISWALMLSKYSGIEDIVFGAVRELPTDITGICSGMFINTLPIRIQFTSTTSIADLIESITSQNRNIKKYFYSSLTEIKQHCKLTSPSVFFDTVVDFKPQSLNEYLKNHIKNWHDRYANFSTNMEYSLALEGYIENDKLYCRLNYNANKYQRYLIKQLANNLLLILNNITISKPDTLAYQLPYLCPNELTKILYTWNKTYISATITKTVHQLFTEQAEKNPNNIAVIYEDQQITYHELNQKSDQLACALRETYAKKFHKDFPPGTLIALCSERKIETIISMLGILKAGGAYVPIGPNEAENRKKQILENSNPPITLSDHNIYREVKTIAPKSLVFNLDTLLSEFDSSHAVDSSTNINKPPYSKNIDAAYVIYTSGSTGQPKGAIVPHSAIIRLVKDTNYIKIAKHNKIAQSAAITFDAATFEIWGALLNSATLVIVPKTYLLTNTSLLQIIKRHRIDTMLLTTELFNSIVTQNPNSFGDLTYLLTGGEKINPLIIKKIIAAARQPKHLLNVYGPTENATISTFYEIPKNWTSNKPLPIGKPIANTTVYILDKYLRPVAIGVCGELYLGGQGLALGYLNDPIRTDKYFIPNPWEKNKSAKIYKTGDVVRWLPDGNIDFIGRVDEQIKLHGFRIELEEIAINLSKHKNIKQAVVLLDNTTNNKHLVAYLVPHDTKSNIAVEEIKTFLNKFLPSYMIPNRFITVDSFPLNTNGKLDKKRLLALNQNNPTTPAQKVLPQNKTQNIIANVWKTLLDKNVIDIHSNIFDLGAHSLLLAQACNMLNKKLQKNLQIVDLLHYTTIYSLAKFIDKEPPRNTQEFTLEHTRALLKRNRMATNKKGTKT